MPAERGPATVHSGRDEPPRTRRLAPISSIISRAPARAHKTAKPINHFDERHQTGLGADRLEHSIRPRHRLSHPVPRRNDLRILIALTLATRCALAPRCRSPRPAAGRSMPPSSRLTRRSGGPAVRVVTDAAGRTIASGKRGNAYRRRDLERPRYNCRATPGRLRCGSGCGARPQLGARVRMARTSHALLVRVPRRCAALLFELGAAIQRDELNWDCWPEPRRWTWDKCDAGSAFSTSSASSRWDFCAIGANSQGPPGGDLSLHAHSPEAVRA